jgi:hypothetical protein
MYKSQCRNTRNMKKQGKQTLESQQLPEDNEVNEAPKNSKE